MRHQVSVVSPLLNTSIAIDVLDHAPPPVIVEGTTRNVVPSLVMEDQPPNSRSVNTDVDAAFRHSHSVVAISTGLMSNDPSTASNTAGVVTKIVETANGLRGRISPEGIKASLTWALLVMIPALLEEYAKLTPEQQAAFHTVLLNKFSFLMSIPGFRLAYEAWRKDR